MLERTENILTMAYKPGDRVGAVFNSDPETVRMFGWGVYDGELPCPHIGGRNNPRITLDDGAGIVWGCESWWGDETKMRAWIGKRKIQLVDREGKDR